MDSNNSKAEILAKERTKLANERTFLAYFRTFVVFLSSGFAILKIEGLHNIKNLGIFFITTAFLLIILGLRRYILVNRKLHKLVKE